MENQVEIFQPSLLFSILFRGSGGVGGLLQNLSAKKGGGVIREGGNREGWLNRAFTVIQCKI